MHSASSVKEEGRVEGKDRVDIDDVLDEKRFDRWLLELKRMRRHEECNENTSSLDQTRDGRSLQVEDCCDIVDRGRGTAEMKAISARRGRNRVKETNDDIG